MLRSVFGVMRTETVKRGERRGWGEGEEGEGEEKTEIEERDLSRGAEQSFQPAAELSFMGGWT